MGIPDEGGEQTVDVEGDESKDDAFPLWPENRRALKCFMHVRRMWRLGPMGGVLGLDRPNMEAELRMRNIKIDAALLDDLAVIEGGVSAVWNAKQSQ